MKVKILTILVIASMSYVISSCTEGKSKGLEAADEFCGCVEKNLGNQSGLQKCQEDFEGEYNEEWLKSLSEEDAAKFKEDFALKARDCMAEAQKSLE